MYMKVAVEPLYPRNTCSSFKGSMIDANCPSCYCAASFTSNVTFSSIPLSSSPVVIQLVNLTHSDLEDRAI